MGAVTEWQIIFTNKITAIFDRDFKALYLNIFKFIIILIIILCLHELGHVIACIAYDIQITKVTIYLFGFYWSAENIPMSVEQVWMIWFIIPFLIECLFIFGTKQPKWWLLIALFFHKFDFAWILMFLMR